MSESNDNGYKYRKLLGKNGFELLARSLSNDAALEIYKELSEKEFDFYYNEFIKAIDEKKKGYLEKTNKIMDNFLSKSIELLLLSGKQREYISKSVKQFSSSLISYYCSPDKIRLIHNKFQNEKNNTVVLDKNEETRENISKKEDSNQTNYDVTRSYDDDEWVKEHLIQVEEMEKALSKGQLNESEKRDLETIKKELDEKREYYNQLNNNENNKYHSKHMKKNTGDKYESKHMKKSEYKSKHMKTEDDTDSKTVDNIETKRDVLNVFNNIALQKESMAIDNALDKFEEREKAILTNSKLSCDEKQKMLDDLYTIFDSYTEKHPEKEGRHSRR